jgi:Ulp1 family protease
MDFWFRWIVQHEPYDQELLILTSHFYNALIEKDGVLEVSHWMQNCEILLIP